MTSDQEIIRKLGNVGQAFFGRFHSLREVQRQSIPPILSGRNVLVSSATASGKTEAIFAPLVSRIQSIKIQNRQKIQILAIAPTRALVNDLYSRLEAPLSGAGWSCGRQTSDHRDKHKNPDALITTPESFDSMLVRDGIREGSELIDHLLSWVESVFIDEAHLFESSPRGAQITWLLGRLRKLKAYALRNHWIKDDNIQICAASATVPDPQGLAHNLLGEDFELVSVHGHREMEMFTNQDKPGWVGLDELKDLNSIYRSVFLANGSDRIQKIVHHIWSSIKNGRFDGSRKMLVFVPSRALCDQLSLALADEIKKRRDIFIAAHHGSLERAIREEAEKRFALNRDAIIVATTTLEVGIDIGDVDVVALVGAPTNTASLLQRIGRAGRRNGYVRILPIAMNQIEARAFSSMIEAATRGTLDPTPIARLWSVFVQQAISYTAQAGKKGRSRKGLLQLAQKVWPESGGSKTASFILDALIDQEMVDEKKERLFLSGIWSDRFERTGGALHHNFDSEQKQIPVIDSTTGEILTHVAEPPAGSTGIALVGQRWDIVSDGGEILIKSSQAKDGDKTFRYAARSAPTSKSFAEHVRRGIGLNDYAAPIVELANKSLWFYFGGSAYETVLASIFPNLKRVKGLYGLALKGNISEKNLRSVAIDRIRLIGIIQGLADKIVSSLSLGLYHKNLPDDVRTKVAIDVFGPDMFIDWLNSREIKLLDEKDERYRKIKHALYGNSSSPE